MLVGGLNLPRKVDSLLGLWASTQGPDLNRFQIDAAVVWSDRPHQLDSRRSLALFVDGLVSGDREEIAAALLTEQWPLPGEIDGSFAVLATDGRRAVAAVDPAGVRRMFLALSTSYQLFGSLQTPIAGADHRDPDLVGVAQRLGLGMTLGRRTLFQDVIEILPGEAWILEAGGSPRLVGREDLIGEERVYTSPREAALDVAPILVKASQVVVDAQRPTIALSGGLDSRIALAAMVTGGVPPELAITFGSPDGYEVRIASRCATTMGVPHEVIDLRGRVFPSRDAIHHQALWTETLFSSSWMEVSRTLSEVGSDVIVIGDILDSLQVRVQQLWGRRARVENRLRSLLRRSSPHEMSIDAWWARDREKAQSRVIHMAARGRIDVTDEEITSALEEDYQTLAGRTGHLDKALRIEEAVGVLRARQLAGSQPQSVTNAIGVALFATRNAAKAGFSIPIRLRAERQVLNHLAREVLPKALGRIPTATIPFVPSSAPGPLLEAVWAGRFSSDLILRRLASASNGRLKRQRLLRSMDLRPEFRQAVGDFYGSAWADSGTFDPDRLVRSMHRAASGGYLPAPIEFLDAVIVDTMLNEAARLSEQTADVRTSRGE